MSAWLPLTHVGLTRAPRDENDFRLTTRAVAWRNGCPVSNADFLQQIAAWREAFIHVPGEQVALYFDDAYDFACALYGAWHARKQAVVLGDAQPATLAQLSTTVQARAGQLPNAIQPVHSAHTSDTVTACQPLDPHATRLAVYTSGSTGQPVQISKTLAQLDAEVHDLESALVPSPSAVDVFPSVLSTVSHQHLYGLLFGVLWPLAAGRMIVGQRVLYPEQLLEQLNRHPASWLVSSPTFLARLPNHVDWQAARSSLRRVFSSGGPLPADAATQCEHLLGEAPVEVFGSSETGGIAWRQRAHHGEMWQALPGVQWRIQADGRLEIQSRYLDDPQQWLTTSDNVSPCESKCGAGFTIQGRADRIVKIAEKRVSLTAFETVLQASAWVEQSRAVVLPAGDTTTVARVGMVVVLSPAGRQILEAQGKRAINTTLRAVLTDAAEHTVLPRHWRYVAALPINPQGKTLDSALQVLFRPLMPTVQWVCREASSAQAMLDVRADLLVLDGHFPGATLVPGVAQLHWAVALARECFAVPTDFRKGTALKFQRPIVPGNRVTMDLDWSATQQALKFSLWSSGGQHASGTLMFGAAL